MITDYTAYPFWEDADASLRDRLESLMYSSEREGKWGLSSAIGRTLEDEKIYDGILTAFCGDVDDAIQNEEVDTDDPYALADHIDDTAWEWIQDFYGLPH